MKRGEFKYRGSRPITGDSKTIQKHYKTRNVYKDQIDDGLYTCWFCGFTCNIDKDLLGRKDSKNHISYSDIQTPSNPTDGNEGSNIAVLGGELNAFVGMELSADGVTSVNITNELYPSSKTGCPLCGTLNWLGKY